MFKDLTIKYLNLLFLAIFFVITCLLISSLVKAVEVKDLYQASVVIQTQNSSDRANALKKALAAVMLKVGGEKSVLDNVVIKKALVNYHLYLNQYRYKQIKRELTSEKTLFLLASFNEQKVNSLFQKAHLPLWGSLRPQVVLWLVEEQGFNRTIMSNATLSNLPQQVHHFSEQRGLPILMPLMDLTDINQVNLSDVWGRFEQPIRIASNRYLAEAIVVMRLSNSSLVAQDLVDDFTKKNVKSCGLLCAQSQTEKQQYVLDWRLINQNQRVSRQYQGISRQELLKTGLIDITELIYQHYALANDSQNELIINVMNVDSLAIYVDVFTFLINLSTVQSATLVQANGESRRFKLVLRGSKEAFLASLKLNKQLTEFIDPLASMNSEQKNKLISIFYWGKR